VFLRGLGMDAEFVPEDVEAVIKGALQSSLSEAVYDDAKADALAAVAIDAALKGLQGLGRPFKYAGACGRARYEVSAMCRPSK
jgi:hypothetical protein